MTLIDLPKVSTESGTHVIHPKAESVKRRAQRQTGIEPGSELAFQVGTTLLYPLGLTSLLVLLSFIHLRLAP